MLRKSLKTLSAAKASAPVYFPKPLVQGQYAVPPAHSVPEHIVKPQYILEPNRPQYGIYEGLPVKHDATACEKLRKSAKIASNTLHAVSKFVQKGMTCEDVDKFVHDHIISQGAYPTPIGFMGFPKSVCLSVNQCLVHGIPNTRPLEDGDSMNIDISVYYDGYHGDNNLMVEVGTVHPDIKHVIETTRKAVYEAIKVCRPGQKFNAIGKRIEQIAKQNGVYVCDLFNGHGIGKLLHMPPSIYPYYEPRQHYVMQPGNVFTIEPILTLFPVRDIRQWKDNFTVISPNNPNAQFQHTIMITETGFQVLTLRPEEQIPQ